jgi:hypothetical protein
MPQNATIFQCELCNFKCSKKSNYEAHLLTTKHINRTNRTEKMPKNANQFNCECGKIYKARNSLWYHKQKCTYIEDNKKKEIVEEKKEEGPDYKELLIQAMTEMSEMRKENNELVTKMTEMIPKMTEMMPSITNTNSNNTTNNNFNLQFFLNETCKDALNLTEFINSLQLQLKDLEYTANNGHIKGITNIFQTALSNMEENKRPMHCTDLKREIMYIKENDEWNKDDEKAKMKGTINQITNKNIGNIEEWLEKYPGHINPNSPDFDKFVKMTSNCMGTGNEEDDNKIVRNIMREVTIDKKKESE